MVSLICVSGLWSCGYNWKATDVDGDGTTPEQGDCWDAEEGPEGTSLSSADINADAEETYYDGVDQNCDGESDFDADGDGFKSADYMVDGEYGEDCDDTNPDINPDATEVCDGVDNNCDGLIDSGSENLDEMSPYYPDTDGDEYGDSSSAPAGYTCGEAPEGYSLDSTDCDDTVSTIHPNALELCDEIDNDCDSEIDENPSDGTTYYSDADGDGYGNYGTFEVSCTKPDNFVDNADDCDDATSTINPNATEICDGNDNDCDGDTDEGCLINPNLPHH